MTDKEQAIAYANEHRQIHVEWVKYYRERQEGFGGNQHFSDIDGEELPEHERVGLSSPEEHIAHHEESIERYDLIIKVLSHSEDWSE